MRVEEIDRRTMIPVPLELVHEFDGVGFVKWKANDDGTFTITLFDEVT